MLMSMISQADNFTSHTHINLGAVLGPCNCAAYTKAAKQMHSVHLKQDSTTDTDANMHAYKSQKHEHDGSPQYTEIFIGRDDLLMFFRIRALCQS